MQKGIKIFGYKSTRFLVVFLFALVVFFILCAGYAQTVFAIEVGLEPIGEEIALGGRDIREIIASIINVFLGLLGIIALVIILYGGFLWMTAGGDAEQVSRAKRVIINGVIGLAIILASWAITIFIFRALLGEDLFGPGGGRPPGGIPPTYESFSSALGNGIIDYHYPGRGDTDVPRNTKIMVTFKEPMLIESMIEGYDDNDTPLDTSDDTVSNLLLVDNVKIYPSADGEGAASREDQVRVRFTEDLQTFVFEPVDWLGSASEDVSYTVELSGIELADGTEGFGGGLEDAYRWTFEVGTFVDVTPPQVKNVFPVAGEEYPKNVLVQINFNEPIDPTSASGHSSRFTNIIVESGAVVLGSFNLSNQYKTAEFIPDEICGTNTCGGDVFCLPGSSDIDVTVRSATMNPGEEPAAVFPYNGIVDMAGNSLDGNANGTAEGPPTDNYIWAFSTSDSVYIEPPGIVAVNPSPSEGGVSPDLPVEIFWDVLMSARTLGSSNIMLGDNRTDGLQVWYSNNSEAYTIDGLPAEGGLAPHHTVTEMRHGLFIEETEYYPEIFSEVQDVYQNCFSPAATADCPKDRPGAPWCCDVQPSASRTAGPCSGIPTKDR